MKKIILSFLLIFCCIDMFSIDVVEYTYDMAGNRVSRKITLVSFNLRSATANPIDSSQVDSELKTLKVSIYPNPTRGTIWVGMNGYKLTTPAEMLLYSSEGKPLRKISTQDDRTPIDLSEYPVGWYLLQVIADDKKIDFKIIKK